MNKIIKIVIIKSFVILLIISMLSCEKENESLVKDIDGNIYHTVKIGNQVWMVENLRTIHYNNGEEIENITDPIEWVSTTSGAYCNYHNNEYYAGVVGRLYNWYAVNTGKLAPVGWHVPSDEEWIELIDYLSENGSTQIAKALSSNEIWTDSEVIGSVGNNRESNNASGFSALPGGYCARFDGLLYGFEERGHWWSSTESSDDNAYNRNIYFDNSQVLQGNYDKHGGISIRCLKD